MSIFPPNINISLHSSHEWNWGLRHQRRWTVHSVWHDRHVFSWAWFRGRRDFEQQYMDK